jgi:hypothetical protein
MIGAPKAGTTSLWKLLIQHPAIHPCVVKEPGFFMRDETYRRGWDWYQSLFAGCEDGQIAMEATTEYSQTLTYPKTAARIARDLPDVKLIYVMRHPFDTLESRWRQSLANRDPIPRSFSDALQNYPPLLDNALHGRTIRDYLEWFPKEKLHIVVFEEFKRDPRSTCDEVFRHLGVDPLSELSETARIWNAGAQKDIDRAWIAELRRCSAAIAFRDALPPAGRRMLRAVTRRKPPTAVWTMDAFRAIQDQVAEDAMDALSLAGKTENYWKLSEDWLLERRGR